MSAHAYTEDQLVEQPAIGLFTELGWQAVSALEQAFGVTGTLLRETKGEVVLVSLLRVVLERLNPALPGGDSCVRSLLQDQRQEGLAVLLRARGSVVNRIHAGQFSAVV